MAATVRVAGVCVVYGCLTAAMLCVEELEYVSRYFFAQLFAQNVAFAITNTYFWRLEKIVSANATREINYTRGFPERPYGVGIAQWLDLCAWLRNGTLWCARLRCLAPGETSQYDPIADTGNDNPGRFGVPSDRRNIPRTRQTVTWNRQIGERKTDQPPSVARGIGSCTCRVDRSKQGVSTMAQAKTAEFDRIAPEDIESVFFERDEALNPDSLETLAESMANRQNDPVTVRPTANDGYELITGFRRYRAIQEFGEKYGVETLKAEISELSDIEAVRTRLHSNLHRTDDTIYDQGRLCRMVAGMLDDPTQSDIAGAVNWSRPKVSKALNALEHPPDVKEAVESGDVSQNAASAIAQEEDPDIREKAIERAKAESLTEEETKEALQEAQESEGLVSDVAAALNRYAEKTARKEEAQEELSRKEEVEAKIEEIEADISEIWDSAPKQASDRWEDYRDRQEDAEAFEAAIAAVKDRKETLSEEAEELALSDAEENRLTQKKADARDLMAEIGDPNVRESERDDGRVTYQISVTVDPDDMPSLLEEYVGKAEDLSGLQETVKPLAEKAQKAEKVRKTARNMTNDVSVFLESFEDQSNIPETVREVIRDNPGESVSSLESQLETVREELEETDETELREAVENLGDAQEHVEELRTEKKQLQAEKKGLNGVEGRVSQFANQAEEAKSEALNYFLQLPEETQEAKLDSWADKYEFDLGFLNSKKPAKAYGTVDIEHKGGGYYEVTFAGETLQVRGKESAEETAETWKADGFEAAAEKAQS